MAILTLIWTYNSFDTNLNFENSIAGKKARIIHLTLVPMEFQAHIIICTVMHLGLDCCHEI